MEHVADMMRELQPLYDAFSPHRSSVAEGSASAYRIHCAYMRWRSVMGNDPIEVCMRSGMTQYSKILQSWMREVNDYYFAFQIGACLATASGTHKYYDWSFMEKVALRSNECMEAIVNIVNSPLPSPTDDATTGAMLQDIAAASRTKRLPVNRGEGLYCQQQQ